MMTCTEASIHGVVKKICSSLGQRRQPARNFKGGEGRRRLNERRRLLTGGKLRERRGKTDLYIYISTSVVKQSRDKPVISANENLSFRSVISIMNFNRENGLKLVPE